jgi:superfamily II DNA/RNA helicase
LLKKGLHKLGFTKPTEIQKQAIPMAINGTSAADVDAGSDVEMDSAPKRSRDVVGVAETVSAILPLNV